MGPLGASLVCLIGVLERLGTILGASSERLGASWARLGGRLGRPCSWAFLGRLLLGTSWALPWNPPPLLTRNGGFY